MNTPLNHQSWPTINRKTVFIGALVAILLFILAFNFRGRFPVGHALITVPTNDSSGLGIKLENEHSVTSGGKVSIPIGITGINASGKNILGVYVKFTSIPAYLGNPVLEISNPSWNKNSSSLSNGQLSFSMEGVSNPLQADVDQFAVISFDVISEPSQDNIQLEAVLSDNTIPSVSHTISPTPIILKTVTMPPNLTLSTNSPIALPSLATSVDFTVGLKGISDKTGNKVTGLIADFSGFSDEFSTCTVSGNLPGWNFTDSGLGSNKMFRVTAVGTGNPLVADQENIFTLRCQLNGQLSVSSINLVGQATSDDQILYNLDRVTITINQDTLPQSYSIKGTISGDVVSNVDVKCGNFATKTDNSGSFAITDVPDGTICQASAQAFGYNFTPSFINVEVEGADVSNVDFTAKAILTCADKGKWIAGDPDKFEIDDIYELDHRLLSSSNTEETPDINGDDTFNHTDVISLMQCWTCLWDWVWCGI